jgi:stringent starvation protein B
LLLKIYEKDTIINISQGAVRNFTINPEGVQFNVSFSGVFRNLKVLFNNIAAIYALETGEGVMLFSTPLISFKNTHTNFEVRVL